MDSPVDPEWFASLLPDSGELNRLEGPTASAVGWDTHQAAKGCKRDCPIGIRFKTLLMLVAISDGVPEVAKHIMHPGNDDRQFGFQVAYKNGLAKFQLLEIVEE